MDKVTGNYLTQSNKDFPLDCETLDALQTNTILLGALGNIGGDRLILCGCELSGDGASRSEGYVFVKTSACPMGEVLRWEGGPIGGGMYVRQEDISISAQGYDWPKAYTRRWLAPGIGDECLAWEDFREVESTVDLRKAISDLKKELAQLTPPPLGIVEAWAGKEVPAGYALCDGRMLRIDDYPEMYAALGATYNTAMSASGVKYQTDAGYFRLPDLRGRFIVGYHDSDNDYRDKGAAGGKKQHALAVDEMPMHGHEFKDYYYPEASDKAKGAYDALAINEKVGSHATDYDNGVIQYYKHTTDYSGAGAPHENRPPYYVLAYIMRLK